jgi:hypothetical protein
MINQETHNLGYLPALCGTWGHAIPSSEGILYTIYGHKEYSGHRSIDLETVMK